MNTIILFIFFTVGPLQTVEFSTVENCEAAATEIVALKPPKVRTVFCAIK